jgi:MFS family permease
VDVDRPAGYRQALRHPVAVRLLAAKGVSELGDFVGLAALLLLAYQQTDSVLGPAAVFAARTVPALLVATVFSGWLDVPPRRTALVWLSIVGGVVICAPAAVPRSAVAIAAAGVLGAVRAAYRSIHMAVVAESVDAAVRLPFFGLVVLANQVAQVGGILAGASVALITGPRAALLADAVTFGICAVVLATLPTEPQRVRGKRPPPTEGLRIIWRQPVLRVIALATWATMLSANLPETLAAGVASRGWVPAVMAGSAFGGAVFAAFVGRTAFLANVANQLTVAFALGMALLLAGAVTGVGGPDWALATANALIGAGGGWLIGAQATFAKLAPPERMGQVEASIVAANIIVGGAGVLLLGWLADLGGAALAYCAGAVPVLVTAALCRRAMVQERLREV